MKKCLSEPRFKLGISDPIANHITTRPRSIYWNRGKNFARFLISNMIYLYVLIQPIRGRNRVNPQGGSELKKIITHRHRWWTLIPIGLHGSKGGWLDFSPSNGLCNSLNVVHNTDCCMCCKEIKLNMLKIDVF